MQLVLMRHGIAVDPGEPGCPPDDQRPLTDRGRRRTRLAADGLAALGVAADVILSSPLARAMETAQLAAEALGIDRSMIRQSRRLLPSADADALLAEVRALAPRAVLCVGHAPQLDAVVTRAVARGAPPFLRLKKAGAARVSLADSPDDASAELVWLMEPRALRRLGRQR